MKGCRQQALQGNRVLKALSLTRLQDGGLKPSSFPCQFVGRPVAQGVFDQWLAPEVNATAGGLHDLRWLLLLQLHIRGHGFELLELPQTVQKHEKYGGLGRGDLLHGVQEIVWLAAQHRVNRLINGYGAGIANDIDDVASLDGS